MLPFVVALSFHLPFASRAAPAPGDSWLAADKAKHFFASAFVQSVGYGLARASGAGRQTSLWVATGLTATVGVGKELVDRRTGGDPSVRDLTWDAAGAGAATLLLARAR